MSTGAASPHREQRFRALYDAAYVDVLRFVRRRVNPSPAEEVVNDGKRVAWRRLDDVPVELSDARAWLFGVAHKTLQGARRREGRQEAVAVRLAEAALTDVRTGDASGLVAERTAVAAA